ncbi:LacI family transcriptional regulator [Clostridium polyendosporum]|uniref:LacI family transcriptional regulator n=1 Tax=Clostridium polyendosporum TaxID=69208 RepID=A0A919RWL4_9CLOT|nr:substrate-binding domain-containing protein [Clostridium polyendosporum]GIM27711.1 LacI family transcriptional regulator [Clostridium polyendosporum]
MKPTIKDVARKANVSVATVSRILNGLDGYSEETKVKVLSVVEELGYQRNAIARGLVMKNTSTIGVLLPDVATNFYAAILNGIEDTAHQNDYSVVVCNTGVNGVRALDYIKVLGERQVDGIIIISINITEELYKAIELLKIPYILVSTMSFRFQMPYVKVDDQQAAYSATQYLIKKGHKDIAMISGDKDKTDPIAGKPRVNGYIQALQDYGLKVNSKLIKYGDFSYESGIKCMEELLEETEKFTAVFAASDEMAVGALSVAYQRKIIIPDELSIIGYDNTKVAEMAIPPLTTVAQPLYEMGKKAMQKILKTIETNEKPESTILPHSIVERSTVKQLT